MNDYYLHLFAGNYKNILEFYFLCKNLRLVDFHHSWYYIRVDDAKELFPLEAWKVWKLILGLDDICCKAKYHCNLPQMSICHNSVLSAFTNRNIAIEAVLYIPKSIHFSGYVTMKRGNVVTYFVWRKMYRFCIRRKRHADDLYFILIYITPNKIARKTSSIY